MNFSRDWDWTMILVIIGAMALVILALWLRWEKIRDDVEEAKNRQDDNGYK